MTAILWLSLFDYWRIHFILVLRESWHNGGLMSSALRTFSWFDGLVCVDMLKYISIYYHIRVDFLFLMGQFDYWHHLLPLFAYSSMSFKSLFLKTVTRIQATNGLLWLCFNVILDTYDHIGSEGSDTEADTNEPRYYILFVCWHIHLIQWSIEHEYQLLHWLTFSITRTDVWSFGWDFKPMPQVWMVYTSTIKNQMTLYQSTL